MPSSGYFLFFRLRNTTSSTKMLLDASWWSSRRFLALFRPRRPRSGLGRFALPPELILMIATHLNGLSIISLALTCRGLHRLCFPQRPNLNTTEKEELLLLLEKDIATLYFCHYCVKPHRWYKRWDNSISPRVEEGLPCKLQLLRNFLCLPLTCYIPYHLARLVMNQHIYGLNHGLPLHIFEEQARIHYPLSGATDSESLHARIVDDKLLLLSVKTISHSRGHSKTLRGYVDSLGHRVCRHFTLWKGHYHYAPVQLPELARDTNALRYFAPCNQSLGSCPFCLTDYCVDISWRGIRKGYFIKVLVYRQIGDCRSPFDWSWRSMTTLQTVDEPRTAHPLEYGPGIVVDRWNKVDGVNSRTKSEWVEIPGLATLR
jgi:hypothetical protein